MGLTGCLPVECRCDTLLSTDELLSALTVTLQWKLAKVWEQPRGKNIKFPAKRNLEQNTASASKVFLALISLISTRWFPAVCSWISASIHHLPQRWWRVVQGEGMRGEERGSNESNPLLNLNLNSTKAPEHSSLCMSAGGRACRLCEG